MYLSLVLRFARRVLPSSVRGAINQIAPFIRRNKRSLIFSLPSPLFRKYQYPEVLAIFLTTRCNLRCFICRREGFKGEDLKYENLFKLKKAIKYARAVDLTGWGEPFLYPQFGDVLKYIYSLNSEKSLLQITTNGTRLSEYMATLLNGHLKHLIISLNAATSETYDRDTKQGKFEETLSSIRAFLSGLEKTERGKIQLHFVAHTENYREIPEFVALAHHLGILNVSIGQYLVGIPVHIKYALLHVKEEYNAAVDKAQDLGGKLGVKVYARRFHNEGWPDPQECHSPFKECFVMVNGDIGPCCFCGNYIIGNAYKTSFEAVWFGKAYRKLREKRYLPACKTCTPFVPFDHYLAHFTGDIKKTQEFEKIERDFLVEKT